MQLDEHQRAAVACRQNRVLLVAPPGSGKTTVLLAKLKELLEEGEDPKGFLILTFSKSAADNLKDRFPEGGDAFFGTVHAFCLQALKQAGFDKAILEEAGEALRDFRRRYELSQGAAARLLSRQSRVRTTGQKDTYIPQKIAEAVEAAYTAYKEAGNFWDFDDLEVEFIRWLKLDPQALARLQGKYRWVLVDEFQDLNSVQIAIIRLVSGKARLFCVGDEDQCIYAFRGSNTRAMVHFEDYFPGGMVRYLRYNYRSSASLIAYANRVICHNQNRHKKAIVSFRQDRSPVCFLTFKDSRDQDRWLVDHLSRQSTDQTQAVICRTNGEIARIARLLDDAGLAFHLLTGPYEPWQTKPLALYPRAFQFIQKPSKANFLRLADHVDFGFSKEALNAFSLNSYDPIQTLFKKDYGPGNRARLKGLLELSKVRSLKPSLALHLLEDGLGLRAGKGSQRHKRLKALACRARDLDDLLHKLREDRTLPGQVLLATMHGVKGMEFHEVILPNLYDGAVPHGKALDDLEAERRLYYVAVTRAKENLYGLYPERVEGMRVPVSRFLKESAADMKTWPKDGIRPWEKFAIISRMIKRRKKETL